jgi:uncharacterized membrane protein YjjP (DUF1212 family)
MQNISSLQSLLKRVLNGNDKKESGEIRFAAADDKLQHYKLFNLFLWSMAAN